MDFKMNGDGEASIKDSADARSSATSRMSVEMLIDSLRRQGVTLAAKGERLRYSSPKGVLTPDMLAEMAERKAEILGALRRLEGHSPVLFPPPPPISRDGELPLSFAQQRLWFLDQLVPNNAFYNVPVAFRLTGRIAVSALRNAFRELLRRHEVLRAIFPAIEARSTLQITPVGHPDFPLIDVSFLEGERREEQARRIIIQEAKRPFDLWRGPMFRPWLIRIAEDDHIALIVLHHIVSDGWSMSILLGELGILYRTFSQGVPSPLVELPIQYVDFAAGQRERVKGELLESQLAYWKRQLKGSLPLDLPTDHPPQSVQSFRGSKYALLIEKPLTQKLKALSRQEGATLFMTLLTAFKTLLHRYSGQADIAVGTPITNRNSAELEKLIGFFANTLVLRSRIGGDAGFREILRREKEVTLEAYTHQDLPFELLVGELQPERDVSHSPLFQVMFVLRLSPMPELELPGLKFSPLEVDSGAVSFVLSLSLTDTEMGAHGVVEYSTDLYERSTIARMAGHLQSLLAGIVEDPDRRISALPLLTDSERHQLSREWNDTGIVSPGRCLHELFEIQAERASDAVAVSNGDQQLSYGALNRRANQLANYLRKLSAGPESIVGVCLERDLDLVVALLAVLKSGAAYLPLDPVYPKQWLTDIMEDAGISLLLARQALAPGITPLRARVICLDRENLEIARECPTNPLTEVQPENPAYIIYTSGSTGKPKGVAIEHRSANLLMEWAARAFTPEELGGVLAGTSICFDLSVFEIFAPLSHGHRMVLAKNALELENLPTAEEVTLVNMVPSAISELVRVGAIPRTVRSVNLAGEPLPDELVRRIFEGESVARVRNLYGPSEDTTYSTYATFEKGSGQKVNIGRPIANTQVYICDQHMEIVPTGAPGELYLGGGGLARCYLGSPELTARKFIPDPFGEASGARLYKTEDLARYRPDGNLDFLGRIDHQVKIRGYRIELGEVESVLIRHPAVESAAVMDRTDDVGNRRLVAYVVFHPDTQPTIEELRKFVKDRLPEYMTPAVYVQLPTLPLTANGKINRQALPAPNKARPELDHAYVTPRSATEEALAQLWSEVLGVESPGIHDHFIELGGDSILGIQFVSRAGRLGFHYTPKDLFQYPTIAELAGVASTTATGMGASSAPPQLSPDEFEHGLLRLRSREEFLKDPLEIEDAYPLSPMQQGMLFHCLYAPELNEYSEQVHCVITGGLNVPAFKRAWQVMIDREAAFRTSFVWENVKEPLQLVHRRVTLPFEEHTARDGASLGRLEPSHFALSQAPLMKLDLFRLDNGDFHLVWSYHHLILDGWSLPLVLRNVFACYEASCRNLTAVLEEGRAYRDYISWLHRQDRQAADKFWGEELRGINAPTRLNLWTQIDGEEGYGLLDLKLSESASLGLQSLARQRHLTLNTMMQGAWGILLSRYSGEPDVIFGGVVSGRPAELAGVESMLGNFLNTLPVRISVDGSASLLPWLKEHQSRQTAARQFEYSSLARIQKMKGFPHGAALFDSVMVFENYPVDYSLQEQSGGRWNWEVHSEQRTGYTLLITAHPGREHSLRFTYLKRHLDHALVTKMAGHLGTLLESFATHPERRLSEASMMTDAEREQILVEWNQTSADFSQDIPFHHLFELQVERAPDSVAVITERGTLTYHEVNRRANRAAWALAAAGVGPEVIVAALSGRGDLLISILAIFKAGGVYLPLDPFHPPERISQILTQSNPSVVITSAEFLNFIPKGMPERGPDSRGEPSPKTAFVVYEIEKLIDADSPEGNLPVRVDLSNLAYVIYTSGSTGVPKGAMIEHRGMVNHLLAKVSDLALTETDIIAQTASQCFDISVWQFLVCLMIGGTVLVCNDEVARDPSQLLEELDRSRVSVAEVVPSFLFGLLAEKKQRGSAVNELAALRWMILTGEALSGEICREWFRRYPTVPLVNAYGPTECSDDITHFVTRTPPAAGVVNTPIGRHLPNIQLYVLGDDWNPLPVGVTGELYAGGVGVGRGYLNDAEQTAKLFPPHPFSRKPGERLYRTGDLTRHLPTGDLEYLGRRDHQVKIRGFRIELGEIEAALLQCPAVEQCAVTSHDFMNDDKRLVAYIVPQAGSTSTPDEWRRFLRDRLPEYLIPSFFMTIARLPLTPNGKIDRKALPQPVGPSPESTGAYIPPRTEIEQLIAGIWQEVLEVEKVGRRDNFFDRGGHSLLMVQAHLKLRAAIKTEITLVEMFRYPTVASMAEYISNGAENKEHVMVQKADNRAAARRESVSTRTSLRSRPN